MDETSFRIGVGGSQWIITMDYQKAYLSLLELNRDYIMSVKTISANSEVLPPLLIIQGICHLQQQYTTTTLPNNYLIGMSPSRYLNNTLLIKWLKHFNKWSVKQQCGAYQLLIFNGYGLHLIKEFVNYYDDHKIILFSLLLYISHNLQPCNVVVF